MQVLVQHGKHGTWLHDATTPEALAASALAILNEHYEIGYFYDPGEFTETWDGPDLETIKSLKDVDEDAYKAVANKWNRFVRRKREHKESRAEYDRLQRALEENDGTLVWRILQDRSDHEYERVELEDVSQHHAKTERPWIGA